MLRFALILGFGILLLPHHIAQAQLPAQGLFARTNLVAWCIVPFDTQKRGPEERAAMLDRLGIKRLAYDWRTEHIPSFDAEVVALQQHGIELTAWWFPSALNDEAKSILACLERHHLKPQLWVTMGTEPELDPTLLTHKIATAVETLAPICQAAAKLGSTVALYNHLGWFGEPTNQVVVIEKLRAAGHTNVGSVYNFHHAHAHIDDFAQQLELLRPYLLAINLNGMVWNGDRTGKKIIPLGTGEEELRMLQTLQASGWNGPVGIIGHTEEDAEVKLRKELVGLEKLAPQVPQAASPKPVRTPRVEPTSKPAASLLPASGPAIVTLPEGIVLDARVSGSLLDGRAEFRGAPFEVEARVRLDRNENWNILVASEAKSSSTHWELYSYAGAGDLSFYSPSLTPDTLRSGINICDGTWHTVTAIVETNRVRLQVDGREVAQQSVTRQALPNDEPTQLAVGRLLEGGLGCDGQIAWVKFTRYQPSSPNPWIIAPWTTLDASDRALARPLTAPPKTPAVAGSTRPPPPARPVGHPPSSGQEPSTQAEKDWQDNRWQETDIGPFLASNVRLADNSTIAKALTVKVGKESAGAVVYDTETMTLRAAWTGGFLKFDPARFGLIGAVRPNGNTLFTSVGAPDPTQPPPRFLGLHIGRQGPVLEYQVNGVSLLENADLRETPAGPLFVRTLWIGPRKKPLTLLAAGHLRGTNLSSHSFTEIRVNTSGDTNSVSNLPGPATEEERNWLLAWNDEGEVRSGVGLNGTRIRSTANQVDSQGGKQLITLDTSDTPAIISIFLWRGNTNAWGAFEQYVRNTEPGENPQRLAQPGPPHWPTLSTRGQRGPNTDFFAVDTLTLPYDNPSKALLFASGVDFTPDGAAYVCTIHGDVWRVTGIDDSLQNLTWQRYATGLFQPLGLKVRSGKVFVLGRDRITRLHDENGDGEADFYESFFGGIQTSTSGHDYVTCLEKDDAGNFYFVDPQGVHRVTADGSRMDTLATGFRNPNGMGVSPDGRIITVAPQQGTWTPSSFIAEIKPGGYYGYGGPKVTEARPLGYDAPLCWIPHSVDNSSGSQVWVPVGQWGPLGGQMLHLLWGRCGMMLALRDTGGASVPATQGAVVPLPVKFLSGPNRATFNSRDGSLYVAGSTGWQTSAVKDGSLQRVRFTGQRMALPVGFHIRPGGLEVTFSQALDRATAEDPGSYGLKEWNYRYAEAYGSKDWSVTHPDQEGRDEVPVKSALLQPDGRSVFLEIPSLRPVMQLELRYNLDAAEAGKPLRGQLWLTVNPATK